MISHWFKTLTALSNFAPTARNTLRMRVFFHLIYLVFLCFFFTSLRSDGKSVCVSGVALCCVTHCVTDFSTNSSRNNATCKPGGSDPLAISISDGAEFFSLVWPKKKKIANKIQQKKEEKKCHIWSWLGPRLRVLLLCMCNCGLIIAKDPTRYK